MRSAIEGIVVLVVSLVIFGVGFLAGRYHELHQSKIPQGFSRGPICVDQLPAGSGFAHHHEALAAKVHLRSAGRFGVSDYESGWGH